MTYSTLLPICLGVSISCMDNITFNTYGFITAALSNICFSTRAVYSKQLFATTTTTKHTTSHTSSNISKHTTVHTINSSTNNKYTTHSTPTTNNNNNISINISSNASNNIDEILLFAYISQIGLCILIPITLFIEGFGIINLLYTNNITYIFYFISIIIVNGIAYSTYNIVSFLVLSRTELVTHAVLNVFRRVFIIIMTSWFFQVLYSMCIIVYICV